MTDAAGPPTRDEAAALLQVDPAAPPHDVQRAFLRAARRVHPDVLPDADEAERHDAAQAFDRLLRARDVLLAPADREAAVGRPAARRRPAGPNLGGSLVVLVLLAFLLVLLVTVEQGARVGPFQEPPAASSTP